MADTSNFDTIFMKCTRYCNNNSHTLYLSMCLCLLQRPVSRAAFGLSYDIISEENGLTMEKRPPARLAKLERRKKRRRQLTEEDITKKLEKADERRKVCGVFTSFTRMYCNSAGLTMWWGGGSVVGGGGGGGSARGIGYGGNPISKSLFNHKHSQIVVIQISYKNMQRMMTNKKIRRTMTSKNYNIH